MNLFLSNPEDRVMQIEKSHGDYKDLSPNQNRELEQTVKYLIESHHIANTNKRK